MCCCCWLQSADDEARAASRAAQCAAIVRDRQSGFAKFHASADAHLRAYTARRRREIKDALLTFARAQIEYEKNMQVQWQDALQHIEQVQQ